MGRVLGILSRAFGGLSQIPKNSKEFGFKAAWWLWLIYVLPSKKGPAYIEFMTKYFDKQFKPVTDSFNSGTADTDLRIPENHPDVSKPPVWVCWLQGEDSMPPLVKMCYRQLKKNIPDYAEIHLLTLDNYSSYVTLPDYVVQKFNDGKITMIHFTDILRSALLYAYGGMWIDSTVFTVRRIPDNFFHDNFYAQRTRDEGKYLNEPSRARWSGFLQGGKRGSKLFCYMRNTLYHYWKYHNELVEYLILDYSMLGAYNNFEECKRDIDSVECNNEDMWLLTKVVNDKFDKEYFDEITKETTFFKLTYKMELKEKAETGEETFYGYLQRLSQGGAADG